MKPPFLQVKRSMFALLFKVIPVNYGAGWIVDHSDEKWSMDPAIRGAQVVALFHVKQSMEFCFT